MRSVRAPPYPNTSNDAAPPVMRAVWRRGTVRSLQAWTVYVFVIGISLLLIPNAILGLFRIAETREAWLQVVGVVVVALGVLYWSMIRREDMGGIRVSSNPELLDSR